MDKIDKRNYGIDLLRVFAMFLIIILHSLGHGGVLSNTIVNSTQYRFAWMMEIFAYCAVDVFALISGFVSYTDKENKIKASNYIKLWLQVVFYSVLITFIFDKYGSNSISKNDYIMSLFPVSSGLYWYFCAYTALFVVMPLLNKAIANCSNSMLKKMFIVIILVFSFFDNIAKKFKLNNGYSFIWLALLYILGAIIKKCEIGKDLKHYKIFISIVVLYIITYLYKMYGFEISNIITKDLLVSYTSPTILGVSILYVIGFSKIKFNDLSKNIIKFSASSAFSIYLINDNIIFRDNIMKGLFINISNKPVETIFLHITTFAITFVITSILIDKIRMLLFKILHIDTLVNKICKIFSDSFHFKNEIS